MGSVPVAVELLSDEHTLKLLHAASKEPMGLTDLCLVSGLTGAACYRRLAELRRVGLIEELVGGSKRYTSDMKRIELLFLDGSMTVRIEHEGGKKETWTLDALSGVELEDHTGRELRLPYLEGTDLGVIDLSPSGIGSFGKVRY
jgi:hypothetical protein